MNQLLAERVSDMRPRYEKMFAERGGVTPSDPLKFHLYHLTLYWYRLIGFCQQTPDKPEGWIDGDLGACVLVGSEFVHKMIDANSPIYRQWQECWKRTQGVLHERPVTLQDVERASQAFDACLAALKYDPLNSKQRY